jgi:hypothetical protein
MSRWNTSIEAGWHEQLSGLCRIVFVSFWKFNGHLK